MSVEELCRLLLPGLLRPLHAHELSGCAMQRLQAVRQLLPADAPDVGLARVASQHPERVQAAVSALLEYSLRHGLLPREWLGVPDTYVDA